MKRQEFRIPLAQVPSASTPPVLVVSGVPEWARALYLGSVGTSGGTVDWQLRTGPGGAGYNRRFTQGYNQYAAIDVSALPSLEVLVTRSTLTSAGSGVPVLVAVAVSEPPDWRWTQLVSWWESVASGVAVVPPGAVGVVGVASVPTWSWVSRDRSGTAVPVPAPLTVGVEAPTLADEYNPGASAAVLWRIRL